MTPPPVAKSATQTDTAGGTGEAGDGERRQCDGGQQSLAEHATVPDEARVGLLVQLLRGRARRDERVEPADGPAGDGDEQKREQRRGPRQRTDEAVKHASSSR